MFTALVPILFAYGGWQSCANIAGGNQGTRRGICREPTVLGVIAVVVFYLSLNVAYLWVITPGEVGGVAGARGRHGQGRGWRGRRAIRGTADHGVESRIPGGGRADRTAVYLRDGGRRAVLQGGRATHPRFGTPVVALWLQAAVSLALMATNTYDQLLWYVVFADWLFFGLTACALLIVRRRDPSPHGEIARAPGHPFTTLAFVIVAAAVVINTFMVYPAQSITGATILLAATVVFFTLRSRHSR